MHMVPLMDTQNEAPSSDWMEITSLLQRYPREVDARDLDAVMSCFTPDAHLSFNGGTATADGEAAMWQFWHRLFSGDALGQTSTHLVSNVVIDINGDRATATLQGVAFILNNQHMRVRGLTYHNELVRTTAGWRLSSMKHSAQWNFEVTPASATGQPHTATPPAETTTPSTVR